MARRTRFFGLNPQGVPPGSEESFKAAKEELQKGFERERQANKRLPFDMYKRPDGIWVMQGASNEHT